VPVSSDRATAIAATFFAAIVYVPTHAGGGEWWWRLPRRIEDGLEAEAMRWGTVDPAATAVAALACPEVTGVAPLWVVMQLVERRQAQSPKPHLPPPGRLQGRAVGWRCTSSPVPVAASAAAVAVAAAGTRRGHLYEGAAECAHHPIQKTVALGGDRHNRRPEPRAPVPLDTQRPQCLDRIAQVAGLIRTTRSRVGRRGRSQPAASRQGPGQPPHPPASRQSSPPGTSTSAGRNMQRRRQPRPHPAWRL
jgi:hypothetical protein